MICIAHLNIKFIKIIKKSVLLSLYVYFTYSAYALERNNIDTCERNNMLRLLMFTLFVGILFQCCGCDNVDLVTKDKVQQTVKQNRYVLVLFGKKLRKSF